VFSPVDRSGHPVIQVDPSRILGIVETNLPDEVSPFEELTPITAKIGEHVADFFAAEIRRGLIPKGFLPVQSGVGNTANAVLMAMAQHPEIPHFQMYTEVIQDAVIALMRQERVTFASGCSLTVPSPTLESFTGLGFLPQTVAASPQEITNNPDGCAPPGTISVNTAIELT